MESLTKQQIVLLMIFVSFVTSIATGIVTVSLTDQNPSGAGVTQTINRIIEHTVERVVMSTSTPPVVRDAPVVTIEDQFAKATETSLRSIVRLRLLTSSGTSTVGIAMVLTKNLVITDRSNVNFGGKYFIMTNNGLEIPLRMLSVADAGDIAYMHPEFPVNVKNTLVPATIVSATQLKLGQTVLMFAGTDNVNVYQGILQNIATKDGKVTSVATDVGTRSTSVGSPLFNITGEFIGIKTTGLAFGGSSGAFLPGSLLKLDVAIPSPIVTAPPTPVATSTASTTNGTSSEVLGTSTSATSTDLMATSTATTTTQ